MAVQSTTESEMSFTINIGLDDMTLQVLKRNDFNLYVFRGIADSSKRVSPLIMSTISDLKKEISLKLQNTEYLAYISTQQLVEYKPIYINKPVVPTTGNRIPPSRIPPSIISNTSATAVLGQLITIDDAGNLTVQETGVHSNIQIRNDSTQSFLTGLGTILGNKTIPFCAQSIFPGTTISIVPKNIFLVVFSDNKNYKNGVYLKTIDNQSMVITTLVNETRHVTYDINDGWKNNNASWGEKTAGGANLNQILTS